MLLQIILILFLGIATGTLTGLIPGIHINLISAFIISAIPIFLYSFNPIYLVVFVVSMAITHTFIDFIPSIFLGCPDTDTELSILPGHNLLKKGQGYEAIILTLYGSLAAIFIILIIILPSIKLISITYPLIQNYIKYFLIFIILFLIYLEKNRLNATIVIFLTGILGFIVLNLENINQPFLPLLTGLFGSSMILISIKKKISIPKQEINESYPKLLKPIIGSTIVAPLCSFLPGLGAGQAAIVGNVISKIKNQKDFLVLLGATNTLVMGFSFISLYALGKTRTGIAVALQNFIGQINSNILILIIIITFLSGIFSFFIAKKLSKTISQNINKISYTKISIITLIILIAIVTLISGFLGLIILIISTLTGIYCISLGVRRTHMMGCLLIPTILFYFGIQIL